MTTEEIVEDVIARHGEQLRLLPKSTGPGLWAWIATPIVLLAGVGLIVVRVRAAGGLGRKAVGGRALSEQDRGELAAALREWDRSGGDQA